MLHAPKSNTIHARKPRQQPIRDSLGARFHAHAKRPRGRFALAPLPARRCEHHIVHRFPRTLIVAVAMVEYNAYMQELFRRERKHSRAPGKLDGRNAELGGYPL